MTRALWPCVVALSVAAFSCEDDSTDEPTDAGPPDAGGKAGSGGGGGGGRPATQCIVDFPCVGGGGRCVGERQLQPYRNKPCEETCGDRLPCSGGSCVEDGDIVDCPEGQRCVETRVFQFGVGDARCVSAEANDCDDADAGVSCPTEEGCGDGQLDFKFHEACDDGNRDDGDGCNRNCAVEDGFDCSGGPCAKRGPDPVCGANACKQGSVCVEITSGEACACTDRVSASCPTFALQSLPLNEIERFDVRGMSGDGSTVFAVDATWTLERGIQLLPIDFEQNALISAISEDGLTLLFRGDTALSGKRGASVRLRDAAFIDTPKLDMFSTLYDLDDSGDVILGDYFAPSGDGQSDARFLFRWENGAIVQVGKVRGVSCIECLPRSGLPAISGDGKVIVGASEEGPFRWSEATGKQMLSVEIGKGASTEAVSRDGSYVVGQVFGSADRRLVRWNAQGQAELLPLPELAGESPRVWVGGISADGKVVVGTLTSGKPVRSLAFIWDETHGGRALTAAISGAQDLEHWQLLTASALSSDGRTVAGNATYRGRGVPYIAHVEAP